MSYIWLNIKQKKHIYLSLTKRLTFSGLSQVLNRIKLMNIIMLLYFHFRFPDKAQMAHNPLLELAYRFFSTLNCDPRMCNVSCL